MTLYAKRILVVEDEPVLANAVVEVMRLSFDANVDLASSGEDAESLRRDNHYDLVVLDWTIPPPSGISLLRAWRQAHERFPVLILSGRDEVEVRAASDEFGADAYLTKPFSLSDLRERAGALLNVNTLS